MAGAASFTGVEAEDGQAGLHWPSPGYCNIPAPISPSAKPVVPPFPLNETVALERPLLSEIANDSTRFAKLCQDLTCAYAALRDNSIRQADHPQGYLREVWTHQFACANLNVHNTWDFLAWHRGFIYFHERLLRSLSGNPSFRLPVWDWETKQTIPKPYADWTCTPLKARSSPAPTFADVTDPCSVRAWLLTDPNVPQAFLGYALSSDPAPQSAGGPHSGVHARVGGFMKDSDTSAADPLFFAHHANVDRWFEFWRGKYLSDLTESPHKQWLTSWLNKTYYFFDHLSAQPTVVSVTVRDLLTKNWGYQYRSALGFSLPTFKPWVAESLDQGNSWILDVKEVLGYLDAPEASWQSRLDNAESYLRGYLDKHGEMSLPVKFSANLVAQAGEYLVGIRMNDKAAPLAVGGFALFADSMPTMKSAQFTGTLCLKGDTLLLVWQQLRNKSLRLDFQLVYAPAPDNGQGYGGKFPPTGFNPLLLESLEIRIPI